MSWFETALEMITKTTVEVTVKNTVGQITKEFYGHGPRTPVRCWVAGPLILHMVQPSGSVILDELAVRPAGQVVMHYNNQLLLDLYRERLTQLAKLALHAEVTALFCDYDAPARQIVGGALLSRSLTGGVQPARPALTGAVRQAVADLGGPAQLTLQAGPGCFWAVLDATDWVPGAHAPTLTGMARADDPASLAAMIDWRAWHGQAAAGLRAACSAAGVRPLALFLGLDQGRLVLGGVLPGAGD